MIVRTYSCLNRRCRHEFNSTGDHPPCPQCRGLRVQWVPRPFAIRSQQTNKADATAAALAADFGMSDIRTPMRDRAAKAAPAPAGKGNVFEPQKGWRVNLPDAVLNEGAAYCGTTGVTAKVKVDPQAAQRAGESNYGSSMMRNNTRIEGTHRGKIA